APEGAFGGGAAASGKAGAVWVGSNAERAFAFSSFQAGGSSRTSRPGGGPSASGAASWKWTCATQERPSAHSASQISCKPSRRRQVRKRIVPGEDVRCKRVVVGSSGSGSAAAPAEA